MAAQFPPTSVNLLSKLKEGGEAYYDVSWKRFLELYHEPIEMIARACYRTHTSGQMPSTGFIEDVVANTIVDFFSNAQHRYDSSKGRLRTYLRVLTNRRVIDLLRKERPIDHLSHHSSITSQDSLTQEPSLPEESPREAESFTQSLLATLVEDLRHKIPLRQFEIFERVKLKHQTPSYVAEDLGIQRAMIDRNVHKAMTALRAIAQQPEYKEEFYE